MSSEFHVHGAHDHEIEHQAKAGVSLAQWVAILSAIFSCIAAFISYQTTSKQNEAILFKNEAIIKTAQASDTWALYQAKKMKAHLMEVAIAAAHDEKQIQHFRQEITRYYSEAKTIQDKAQSLENAAHEADAESDKLIKPHERFAQSMMLLQIAISLASITALTRKRWLLGLSLCAAVLGISLAIGSINFH